MSPLDKLLETPVQHTEKGMPPTPGLTLGDIAGQDWNVLAQDMSFPVALIRQRALAHNARWMERFARDQDLWLYPHGKTTMAPQLFALQLKHGCRGITAANPTHAEVYLQFGVSSVFIANQVTGRQALQRLAGLCEQYPQAEFFLIVDSESNAREIAESLAGPVAAGQLIPLIEIGAPGGRTGLRTAGDAGRLARLMKELEIPARGIEAFEGIFNMDEPGRAVEQVHAMLSEIQRAYIEICESGDFADGPCYLSAGGSSFYDLVAHYFQQLQGAPGPRIIVRAGCYISHDSGVYKRAYADLLQRGLIDPGDHLHPALEVWAQVQSQPEPGRAFATAGKRDLSYDIELPVVQWWFRPGMHDVPQAIDKEIEVTALSDQHSHLSLAEGFDLQIGDLLGMGISHPCTTFDKWKYLFTISDDYTVTGAIKTFF